MRTCHALFGEEVCSFQAAGCGFFSPERRKHPIRIDGSKRKKSYFNDEDLCTDVGL